MKIKAIKMIKALLFVSAAAFSAEVPVIISSYEDLEKIRDNLGGTYELDRDLEDMPRTGLDGEPGFRPIGTRERPFTGKLYGKNFVVRGLYVYRPGEASVGLFGVVGDTAEIWNLGVEADSVIGQNSVGILAGVNNGKIIGCFTMGYAEGKRDESNAGGLAGINAGDVSRSYSSARVVGKRHVGGLLGLLTGSVSNSYAMGSVRGTEMVGGLVGYTYGGAIEECYATGYTEGANARSVVGGLVGGDFVQLNTSYSVRATDAAGKPLQPASVINSFWDVTATGVRSSSGEMIEGSGGKTTAEMMDSSTFASWDFDSTWKVTDGALSPQLAALPMRTISYSASNGGRLLVNGVGMPMGTYVITLVEGTAAPMVTAVPADTSKFEFVKWSDEDISAARRDTARNMGDGSEQAYIALFSDKPEANAPKFKLTYEVASGGEDFGYLSINSGGVSARASSYELEVFDGTRSPVITAEVKPACAGCAFLGWSDGVTSAARSDIAAGRDMRVYAKFSGPEGPGLSVTYRTGARGGYLIIGGEPNPTYVGWVHIPEGEDGPPVYVVSEVGFAFTGWDDSKTAMPRIDNAAAGNAAGQITVTAMFTQVLPAPITYISTAEQLRGIADNLGGYYELAGDIILTGDFTPIGTASAPFTGTLVGNGFKISGLTVSATGAAGLFGYADGARISGVVLENANVAGGAGVGALVGSAVGTVIDSCGASGTVLGAGSAGGLVGVMKESLVRLCYSTANVNGTAAPAGGFGGLIGFDEGSLITHSYASGDVIAVGANAVGGFIGSAAASAVQNSYAAGTVKGAANVGGFAGGQAGGSISWCYAAPRGGVTGDAGTSGGFAGTLTDGKVTSCFYSVDRAPDAALDNGVGEGIGVLRMLDRETYIRAGWDFTSVWATANGKCPYLRALDPGGDNRPGLDGIGKKAVPQRQAAAKRIVKISGRTMNINAPSASSLTQISVVDMKGRTVFRKNVNGSARISLAKIPAGSYAVEVKRQGKRINVSRMVLK